MELQIRPLNENDYNDILVKWWRDWRWSPPPRDFLPQDGTGGFIVYDGDSPVCAGFLYSTNSKAAWVDFIISSRTHKENRQDSISLLIRTLTEVAKNIGYKYTYALLRHKNLIKTYEDIGYIKGDSNTYEMIKKLQ